MCLWNCSALRRNYPIMGIATHPRRAFAACRFGSGEMLFRQVIHEDLGCASYLVGDTGSGIAAVVDPQWDIEPYLDLARLHGVRIGHVLETHNHADHVSGHGRLARATGATIHVNALAGAEYEHEPFDDGWALELGAGTPRSRRSTLPGTDPSTRPSCSATPPAAATRSRS